MRWLLGVLVLANGLFLAWAQGWLGLPPPGQEQREPWRLQAQQRPEAVLVLSPRVQQSSAAARPEGANVDDSGAAAAAKAASGAATAGAAASAAAAPVASAAAASAPAAPAQQRSSP
jgi:hypothetical protein